MTYRENRCRGIAFLLAVSVMLLCAACGGEGAPTEPPAEEQSQQEVPARPEQVPEDVPQPEQETEAGFTFSDVAGLEFYFSSGAGAWRTVLHIHEDGTFDGIHSDSDMGDMGEGYPNGTLYYSEFSGAFTQPESVNAYTCRMELQELTYAHDSDEEIKDGVRYVYTDAYGISGAEEVLIYLPGAKLADLPESYREWVGYYDLTQTEETELPFYGLYNVTEGNGFSSYPAPDPAELLQAEVSAAELLAAAAEESLQAAMTQTDMNLAAGELYRIWDDTLNTAWMYLKESLDEETMQQLTTEQLDWIAEKEAAAAAAGAMYEGGSMQGMAVNLEAAEWTRQRVYVLAEYLKK